MLSTRLLPSVAAVLAFAVSPKCGIAADLYRDAAQPIERRVDDLLGRMTLDEKVAQLRAEADFVRQCTPAHRFDETAAAKTFANGIGTVGPVEWDTATQIDFRNALQAYVRTHTRLGIPVMFHDEGCHGVKGADVTAFPVPIGFACSWDPQLVERAYNVVAEELRARGVSFVLAPVVDICREPRWGRIDETMGEDPFLNGILGAAMVNGFQGRDAARFDRKHVAATLKHFTGHGQPEGGINRAPADVPVRLLYETHLVPFEKTIALANPAAVMPSYNEIDGVPSHGSVWLLQDVLRRQFGFRGLVASDYNGVKDLWEFHHLAADGADAARQAFLAGVQMDLPQGELFAGLGKLVAEKQLTEAQLDAAVRQVLTLKFQLGLFDEGPAETAAAIALPRRDSSKALALQAARESIVLLSNPHGVLPLARDRYKRIAVIGPNAAEAHLGSYSGDPVYKVSVLDGIREKVGSAVDVVYAEGCKITKKHPSCQLAWRDVDALELPTAEENRAAIAEAERVARTADLVVLVIGENESICREAWAAVHRGDRSDLRLFGAQPQLADALLALGKPVVVYLMNGRPLAIPEIVARADAVIEGWYMGQETGHAAADVLFGDVNPSGKLTVSVPRSVGSLPVFYNHKPSLPGFGYLDGDAAPLFPFGHGLSYTRFDYSRPELARAHMSRGESSSVAVTVTNAGPRAGDEVVQLYIHDKVSSVTRPVKELKGFRRISLQPGQSERVTFELTPDLLAMYDVALHRVVEPGEFEILVGPSSATANGVTLTVDRD